MNQNVLEQKKQVVSEIRDKIAKSQSVVLVDYRGLTVENATDLRNKYREAGVEYKVYKNTLMRFALNELGITGLDEQLNGPSAIAISYDDVVTGAKITNEFARGNDKLKIKAGIAEGKVLDSEAVKALANIPSREVLLGQLAGVLQANIKNLAYMLSQVSEKNDTVVETAPVVEEAPVVETPATEAPVVEETAAPAEEASEPVEVVEEAQTEETQE